jgi:hypothetical protein
MKKSGVVLASLLIVATSTSMAADYYGSSPKKKTYPAPTSNSQNINNRTNPYEPFARDDVSAMPTNPRVSQKTSKAKDIDFGRRAMEEEISGGTLKK